MDCTILVNFALLATFGGPVAGKLLVKPRDTDAKVNQSTYFNCSTDHGSTAIFWFHGTKYVYTGFSILQPYHERFRVDRYMWNGTYVYNLVIHSVQPGDAGVYICHEDEGVGEKYSIQLVVLDGDPICRSSIELDKVIGQNTCNVKPDEVELSCIVTYHGNIAPHLEWKKDGDDKSISEVLANVTSANHYDYILTLKGDISLDKSVYICQARRTVQQPHQCVLRVINVMYALGGNSVVNKTINDDIICHANTTQSCNYKWRWFDDNDATTESSSAILKPRKTGLHKCEAECFLRNETCNLLVIQAMVYGDTESSQMRNVIISVSVVATLVVVVALIFVFCHRNRKKGASALEMEPLKPEITSIQELYSSNPIRIHTITTQAAAVNDRIIKGTAILNNELFIISQLESEIEIYDCTTLLFRREWQLNDLMDPDDATSCVRNRCIYISDNNAEGKEIFRIDVDGNIISRWSIGDESGRLSITNEATVILSLHDSSKLVEYSPDGLLIRQVQLSSGLTHPMHAVRLANGNFVMTQGYLEDTKHRVCEVSSDGKYLRSFGDDKGSGSGNLTNPTYLAVDREGSIMVADAGNGRVLLIGSNFQVKRQIVGKKNGLFIPTRICLDEINGRLYVAEYKRDMRNLLVFNVK